MAEERLEEIRAARIAKRQQLLESGVPAYPAEVRRSFNIGELVGTFDTRIKDGTAVELLGRILAIRLHGSIAFVDIGDESGKIQLQFAKDMLADRFDELPTLDTGDFIEISGVPGLSKRGEKTIFVSAYKMASKALRPVPSAWFGIKDIELKSRQRELDLLANPDSIELFKKRSAITTWIRGFFDAHGFMEVETPMLQPIAGGTLAQPFSTHHNALDADLFLRIAPELYLKRLLVGGFEKVFEIGKNFRNEGVDKSHNPEFTMLEAYWAYADYEDMMDFTEDLLVKLVKKITGSHELPWDDTTLSFQEPLARYSFGELMQERLGVNVFTEKNIETYKALFEKHNVAFPNTTNIGKIVDELYKELVRPTLVQPTILYDYPGELVPLAKRKIQDENVAEMFQVVVAGMEIVKAYSELNDPIEQRKRFEEQQAERDSGDTEAHAIDESYIRALEYGMPPASGIGIGIDRLVMLLTNTSHLRDVILFPLLKAEDHL